jgi:Tol biopolymer transport system component
MAPAISPGGRRVALNQGHEIWVVEYPGPGARSLTAGDPGAVSSPRWHPDGRTLVVFATGPGSGELELIDVESSARDTVLSDDANNLYPDWSPDGGEIVYSRFPFAGADGGLFQLVASTGLKTEMLDSLGTEAHPRWSPDATHVSFHRSNVVDVNLAGVWLHDLGTGTSRQVSRTAGCPCPFSPDGRELVYHEREMTGLVGLVRYTIATESRALIVPGDERLYALPHPDWGR